MVCGRVSIVHIPIQWSERPNFLNELINFPGKNGTFGRTGPEKFETPRFDAHLRKDTLHQMEATHGLVVLVYIMTISGMAARNEHRICTSSKGLEHESRVEAAGAHQADESHIGRIFHTSSSSHIGGAVRAPVAGKAD